MSILPSSRAGFVPGSDSQRARRRRTAALAQLVAGTALTAALVITITAVSIGIAGAAPRPAVGGGTGVAVATFLAVLLIGLAGLAAFALHERRAR
jgi:hypothetical protein